MIDAAQSDFVSVGSRRYPFRCWRFETIGAASRQMQAHAFLGKCLCKTGSDALRGSRDKHALSSEFQIHEYRLSRLA